MGRINRFLYRSQLTKLIDFIDFTFFLPVLRYLPVKMSEALSKYRGIVRFLLDIDWRSVSMGFPYIRHDTKRALSLLCGKRENLDRKVMERFMHQSREEMEAVFFAGKKNWPKEVRYENLESLLAIKERGRGLVLLGAHYDSCGAGAAFLGMRGFTVNIYFDEIVYDSRVPKYIQNFFMLKYGNITKYLNGGAFISKKNMKEIYGRLSKGEVLIVLSDVLNFPHGVKVRFLDRECVAPSGAMRIALKTNAYLSAFLTLHEGSGIYKTICATPTLISEAGDPDKALQGYYSFLSDMMMKAPERWWACDKLLEFK